jgi:hypothetical protein
MSDHKPARAGVAETAAAVAATGQRFCLDHRAYVNTDKGCVIQRGKSARWVCFVCQENRKAALANRPLTTSNNNSP